MWKNLIIYREEKEYKLGDAELLNILEREITLLRDENDKMKKYIQGQEMLEKNDLQDTIKKLSLIILNSVPTNFRNL